MSEFRATAHFAIFACTLLLATLLACGNDDDVGLPAADADLTAPDAGLDAATCGGFAGMACPATHYCDYPDDLCGAADGTGTCQPRPLGCPDPIAMEVCGCDGTVYSIDCDARLAGFDVSALGGCAAPAGQFGCGSRFCAKDTQYCRRILSDVYGYPDTFMCLDVPAACPAPADRTCMCFSAQTCGDACEESPGGDFTLVCGGG
jgi:hypothetical protein